MNSSDFLGHHVSGVAGFNNFWGNIIYTREPGQISGVQAVAGARDQVAVRMPPSSGGVTSKKDRRVHFCNPIWLAPEANALPPLFTLLDEALYTARNCRAAKYLG